MPCMLCNEGNEGKLGKGGSPNGADGIGIANFKLGGLGILHLLAISIFQAIKTISLNSLYNIGGGVGPTVVTPTGIGIVC